MHGGCSLGQCDSEHTSRRAAEGCPRQGAPARCSRPTVLQAHAQATGLPLPGAIRNTAVGLVAATGGGGGGGGDSSMAVAITAACVAIVGAAVLAVLAWIIVHRRRSRNMEPSDNLSKVCPGGGGGCVPRCMARMWVCTGGG